MERIKAAITSVGSFLPEKILTNHDLEKMLDTTDEWIVQRTGIHTRHILEPGLGCSYMASRAAKECLERAGTDATELDVIIVATVSPDMMYPSTACLVQKAIGADKTTGFDLMTGCSSFLFALITGAQLIESGRNKKVMVIGSDVNTMMLDYEERTSSILFGDGAGAVLLEPSAEPDLGIIDFISRIDGVGEPYLYLKAGGSRRPASHETVDNKEHYVFQDGRTVFKYAVKHMADFAVEMMKRNNLTSEQLDLFIPHQANLRIIEACADRMGINHDKVIINIDKYANTTSGTVPLCFYDAVIDGRLKKGDNVVIATFGAGFAWGSMYLKWAV